MRDASSARCRASLAHIASPTPINASANSPKPRNGDLCVEVWWLLLLCGGDGGSGSGGGGSGGSDSDD